jgi:drug/metabolite transporter (DMT)-like permease
MWQVYVLLSLFATAGENVVDKFAIATDRKIDSMVATFWRLFFFTVMTSVIGVVGWFGELHFIFAPVIFLVALVGMINSIFYTYLLRHIEIIGIGAMTYLAPFVFILIDTNILHMSFSVEQITGMILMVVGGFSFAIDGNTHHFKKEWSPVVWCMFLYSALYIGVEGYAFKYAHVTYGTGAISFCASYGLLTAAGLLCGVLLQRKSHLLFNHPSLLYIPKIAVSKTFDAMGTVLWTQALVYAAVSQVSAMTSLEPLVLFGATYIAQNIFRMRVEEKFDRKRLKWKAAAVTLLVVGGILMT